MLTLLFGGCSNDPSHALDRAKALRAKGDNAAAAVELKNALKEYPRDPALFQFTGEVLADLGDLPNAENALRRAIEFGRPRAGVVPILGRVLVEREKFSEALEVLKDDGIPDPGTAPQMSVLRGRAYLGQAALLEAKTEFHVSLNVRPSAAAKLGLAQVALVENDRAAAERMIAEAIDVDPKNADPLVLRAELLRLDGRVDDAAAAYRAGIKLDSTNFAALIGLATLELSRDRKDAALLPMQRAEKIAPHSPRMHFAKGWLAFKQKNNEEAIRELAALLEAAPTNGPGLLLAATVQFAEGNYELTQIALATYLQRFPGDLVARRMLATTLLANGQPHLAANVLAPILATTNDVGTLAVAADAYRLMGGFNQSRAVLRRALKLAPEDPTLHTSLALTDLASGARQRALAGLEAAIALGPKNTRADEALIMVLLGQDQIERAEQVAAALEKRLPDLSSTYVLHGAVLIVKKDWPRARASLERALQLDPRNLQAVDALSDVDAGERKPDRRRERIDAILNKDPRHVGALLALAMLDLAQGGNDKGVATIRRAISEQPQSANALLLLADTQFRHGQIGEAIISARQANDLHPFDTRVMAVLGEAQMAVGDQQAAIATLTKLTTLQPDVVSGYLRLAAAQLAAGDTKTAAATVLAALQKAPQDRGAKALLADIYLAAGELDRAQALASQVQKEEPKAALGYRVEGDVLLARKEYARALDALKKAAAIQVNGALLVRMHRAESAGTGRSGSDTLLRTWLEKHPDDVETRFYLSDVLRQTGRHREAIDQYREILRRLPNSARALNDLAWTLYSAGDKRALDYARQAVNLAPASAAAVDTLGWIMVEQGNLAEGVPALLKAVQLDGNVPEIRFHLVQALLKIGDKERAKTELDTLLRSNKPFSQIADARSLAEKLRQ